LKPRVLIFEDNDIVRATLTSILDNLGYEVFSFSNPGMCPQYDSPSQDCLCDDSCSDIIISDIHMPVENGIDFIENRLKRGCKIKYRALMSADWNDRDLRYAEKAGCKVFFKPFDVKELLIWLDACRKQLNQNSTLSNRSAATANPFQL
jgi:CheY-like chemotaxis protein